MIRAMGRQQTGSVHHFGVAAPGDVDNVGAHTFAGLGHLDGLLDGDAAGLEIATGQTNGQRHRGLLLNVANDLHQEAHAIMQRAAVHVGTGVVERRQEVGEQHAASGMHIDDLKTGALTALGRIADGNHRDITINEFDTVILASSLIPGNEHGVYKVINKLVQLGARVVNRDNAAVHVSGHCNEGELLYMYNIVKPKCAMPIHGENRHLVANGMIAVKTGVDPQNVVLAEDGDVVDLYHGQAAVVGSVPCGYVYVDGDSVGELTDEELEKRRILGTEGFVSSFVVVDTETADVITGPKIYLNAVAEDESEFDKVRHQIVEQLQDAMMQGTRDTYKLQQIMRRTLGGWVARQLHRKPMIVPVVADIAQDVDDAMGLNAAK